MNEFLQAILFLPDQASTFAERVDLLHYFVIIVTMLGSLGVGTTAVFFFVKYRRRREHQVTEYVVPSISIEFLFVTIPLVLFIVWFVIGLRDFTFLSTPPKNSLDVYVMAKQWMWKFSYPEGPNGVNVLHVPANRPVRLLMTSRDVIHAFYVPEFRIKSDVMPNRYTQIWFEATKTGTFQVLCTEYCGLDHSRMLAEVVVMEPAEYDRWLEEQRRGDLQNRQDALADKSLVLPSADMVVQGQRLAGEQGCFKCHSPDGEQHIGPTFLGMYGRVERLEDGRSIVADEGYITQSMMDPGLHIVAGYQNVMPTYQGKLHGAESAAIVEYIKSLKVSDIVPPASKGPVYERLAE